jgi:hypothetical protein
MLNSCPYCISGRTLVVQSEKKEQKKYEAKFACRFPTSVSQAVTSSPIQFYPGLTSRLSAIVREGYSNSRGLSFDELEGKRNYDVETVEAIKTLLEQGATFNPYSEAKGRRGEDTYGTRAYNLPQVLGLGKHLYLI